MRRRRHGEQCDRNNLAEMRALTCLDERTFELRVMWAMTKLVDDPRLRAWLDNPSLRNEDALIKAVRSRLA